MRMTLNDHIADPTARSQRERGFTLVELGIVLLLIALVAGLTAASLDGVRQAAQFDDVVGMIQQHDRLTRTHAERFGRATQVIFDLEQASLTRDGASLDGIESRITRLPPGYQIKQVRRVHEPIDSGQVALAYSTDGRCADYTIHLTHTNGQEAWLLLAGLTGQWTHFDKEQTLEATMDILASSPDATRDDAG